MRLTARLCAGMRDHTQRWFNNEFRKTARYYDEPMKIPPALVEKGVQVVDMHEMMQPSLKPAKWAPVIPAKPAGFVSPAPGRDDPRWAVVDPPELRADWKTQPAFSFSLADNQLYEGVLQACMIAKAQHFEEMPASVQHLIGAVDTPDRDMVLQRYIMLSQMWNTEETKLPKRKAPEEKFLWKFTREFGATHHKSCQKLLTGLLRLSQSHVVDVPSLASRRHIYNPLFQSYVMHKDTPIIQQETLDCVLTGDSELPPFVGQDVVDASAAHKIPDMYPVLPTVDFTTTNNYDIHSNTGFRKFPGDCIPHTLVQMRRCEEWEAEDWTTDHYQGGQLMTCLMYTANMARAKFGDDVRVLTEPISIQHIHLGRGGFLFTFFQLNTLDLDTDTGPKNLVWTAPKVNLFDYVLGKPWMPQAIKRQRLENYNAQAFDQWMAVYMNGCVEAES